MSYRKQISYLELWENGQRIQNVGYARLESRENESVLTVQAMKIPCAEGRKPLYLLQETGEELLCEITVDRGNASCVRRFSRRELQGIRILLDHGAEIRGRFAGQEQVKKETGIQERSAVTERAVPEETPARETAEEKTLHMQDTKWEQLSSIYPHIHPFRDAREFLSVGPEDFVVLRERCYHMTHNSFLLHGYYNYRHLLLLRQETSGQARYYIGVPGNFYEREKQVARMFGFESFEGAREPAREGDFGYYLISVEL